MKQSFNLLREYVKKSIFFWNKIQEKNHTRIEIELDEDGESFILYDSLDPFRFGSLGNFFFGIHGLGYNYTFRWNGSKNRLEALIF